MLLAVAKPFWARFTEGLADLLLDAIRLKLKQRRDRGYVSGEINQPENGNTTSNRDLPNTARGRDGDLEQPPGLEKPRDEAGNRDRQRPE